jgi:hypothetical protein
MSIFKIIKKLMRGHEQKDLLTFRIRCNKCQEIIEIKINPVNDLMNQYKETGEAGPAFILKKEILGNNCNNLIQLKVEFDERYNILSESVEGGEISS